MPCFRPLHAYRGPPGETGRPSIVFKRSSSVRGEKLDLPCGSCVGCRLERSRQWAVRCVHEASLYDENTYITLTYNEKNLPKNLSLDVSHFQKFLKRLRKKFTGRKIRFFHCGEYGEKKQRPHYHALLFNIEFKDKKFFKMFNGNRLYKSDILTAAWSLGFATIGDLTFESAAYVARYCMKKITNKETRVDRRGKTWPSAAEHYHGRKPEYTTMSRGGRGVGMGGIGKGWYEKNSSDVFPNDSVVVRGREMRPPKFYDRQLEKTDPDLLEKLKKVRIKKGTKMTWRSWKGNKFLGSDNDLDRLIVKEAVKIAQMGLYKREIE